MLPALARLPCPAQPGPGRPSDIRPNRRLPALTGSRSGVSPPRPGWRRPPGRARAWPCRQRWWLVPGRPPGRPGRAAAHWPRRPPRRATARPPARPRPPSSSASCGARRSSGGRGSGGVTASPPRSWPSPAAHQPAPGERPWRSLPPAAWPADRSRVGPTRGRAGRPAAAPECPGRRLAARLQAVQAVDACRPLERPGQASRYTRQPVTCTQDPAAEDELRSAWRRRRPARPEVRALFSVATGLAGKRPVGQQQLDEGFEPLTPYMPYTACPSERPCSEPSPLVKARSRLPAGHRCCPLLSPASCPRHAPGRLWVMRQSSTLLARLMWPRAAPSSSKDGSSGCRRVSPVAPRLSL